MAVELEGLEFQIEAKSEEGTKGIDALAESLGKLKKAVKGGLGLNSSVKQLTNLNKALEGFHSEKLEKLSNALGSLSGAKSTIPSTLPKRISELGTSLQNLRDEDIDRLERVSNVLHGMGDLSNVRIPRVNVPTTGVAPTMTTPGNTATDAIDSGVEEATGGTAEASSLTEKFKTAMGSLGGVFQKTKNNMGQFLSTLSNTLKSLNETGKEVGTFKNAFTQMGQSLGSAIAAKVKAVTSTLGRTVTALSGFGSAIKEHLVNAPGKVGSAFAQLGSKIKETLISIPERAKSAVSSLGATIKSGFTSAVSAARSALTTLGNVLKGAIVSAPQAAANGISSLGSAIKSGLVAIPRMAASAVKALATGGINLLTHAPQLAVGGVKALGSALKTGLVTGANAAKTAVTKLASGLKKLGGGVINTAKSGIKKLSSLLKNGLSGSAQKSTSKLGQMFNSIKRIAMYRAIRAALSAITQALKEGINNLYQYSNAMGGTFAQSMDRLATSSQYLKNSLGAMAAPIINALAPV